MDGQAGRMPQSEVTERSWGRMTTCNPFLPTAASLTELICFGEFDAESDGKEAKAMGNLPFALQVITALHVIISRRSCVEHQEAEHTPFSVLSDCLVCKRRHLGRSRLCAWAKLSIHRRQHGWRQAQGMAIFNRQGTCNRSAERRGAFNQTSRSSLSMTRAVSAPASPTWVAFAIGGKCVATRLPVETQVVASLQ